jgi:RNA polymerase sigma factor (sigma-70 family)
MEEDPSATQEALLVASALQGNQEALGLLVSRYQNLVASVAWRYGIRREEIEDLVSEVFFKMYRNLHQYRPDYPFPTWLYRLAANHVVDHVRRERRERGRAEMPEQLADDSPGAGEAVERSERASLLRAALREVDPRYREALFLVYVEGLKVEEAAGVLGIPEGTVKTRLMRGREALRKLLGRRHPEHFGG